MQIEGPLSRRQLFWRVILLFGASLVVAVGSTIIREIIFFEPSRIIARGEVTILRQLVECGVILLGGIIASLVILVQARKVRRLSWRRALFASSIANLVAVPVGFVFLSLVWWRYLDAAIWTLLLGLGGTILHAAALRCFNQASRRS